MNAPTCFGITAVLLGLAVPVGAGVSTPPDWPGSLSTVPARIVIAGTTAGIPDDGASLFEVRVCRFNNCHSGEQVTILSSHPGIALGRSSAPIPSRTSCTQDNQYEVFGSTDVDGWIRITLTGSIRLDQLSPDLFGPPTVELLGSGVLFGHIPVVCFDLDGVNGVGVNDIAEWLRLFGSGQPWLIADYDGTGDLNINDLSLLLQAYGSGSSTETPESLCP